MSADTAVLILPAVVAACCWLFWLRRTAAPTAHLMWQLFIGFAGTSIVGAVEQPSAHTTWTGALAVALGPAAVSLLTVWFEATDNHIGTRRQAGGRWTVRTIALKGNDRPNVRVWVEDRTDSERYRIIGEADPLADQGAYLALIAEARNAADELNALKVGE